MQAKKHHNQDEFKQYSLEESVSLWVDGELPSDVDQLDSPYGRQLWENYHLIGDVLRSEDLAVEPSDLFYARVAKAIDEEPIVFAPNALKITKWKRWGLPAAAISAALVASLWVLQPEPIDEVTPVLASADELWVDYIDAHRSLAGAGPASYVSYSVGQ